MPRFCHPHCHPLLPFPSSKQHVACILFSYFHSPLPLLALVDTGQVQGPSLSRHFNDGIRAYYFALAELSWFFHPWALMLSTAWVVLVLYRREFHSKALAILE